MHYKYYRIKKVEIVGYNIDIFENITNILKKNNFKDLNTEVYRKVSAVFFLNYFSFLILIKPFPNIKKYY